MPLANGSPFGAYVVVAPLGAGGMGEVYRARDRRLGREIALKILPPLFAADSERLARFEREAQLLASLNHPNIATIHGVEQVNGVLGLVLELIEGETLADRIARGPGPLPETLRIAGQLIDALEAAHEKGIVHRDLKPANIKLTRDGLVKVLDFGLAKALDSGAPAPDLSQSPTITASGTRAGVILGTAGYMSPEQTRGQAVDRRTDIWAFGCVLYELLAGRPAYERATVPDTLVAVLERDPDWDALPIDTPPALRRVLQRCLTRDIRRRTHDIADVRIDLEDVSSEPTFDRSVLPTSTQSYPPVRWLERAAWTAAVVLLAGLAGWLFSDRRQHTETTVVEVAIHPPPGTTFVRTLGGPWPRVSPDGSTLAFVALSAGGQQIWIRSLDSAVARPLEGTDGAVVPFWSPDNQSIGFFANGELRRIDLASRTVRVLAEVPYSGGLSGTWGENVIVINGSGGVWRVPPGGGAPERIIEATAAGDPAVASFLPDGQRFVYTVIQADQSRYEVCLSGIDNRESRCVPGPMSPVTFAPSGHLVFVRDGRLQAQGFDQHLAQFNGDPVTLADAAIDLEWAWQTPPFSVSTTGVLAYYPRPPGRLAWLDRSGKQLELLPIAGATPAVSPDGNSIALVRRDPRTLNADLWLYNRIRGVETRLTFTPGGEEAPSFSSDGTKVLYSTGQGNGLFQKPVDGGTEIRVGNINGGQPDWSSDGRFVAYMADFDIWVAPLSGDGAPIPIAQTTHGEREPAFSPNLRWIAYDSTETGRREVWVQPFPPTGARWQISTTGGVSAQWRADSRELFYVAADGKLMAVPITAQAGFTWESPRALFETVFRGGTYAPFVVSADGQRFLIQKAVDIAEESPITVVVNWTSRLPR